MTGCPAGVEGCDCLGRNAAHREQAAERYREHPDPWAASLVSAMCHWMQNRGNARREDHLVFHFGNSCPYAAMAAVLTGQSDPRD